LAPAQTGENLAANPGGGGRVLSHILLKCEAVGGKGGESGVREGGGEGRGGSRFTGGAVGWLVGQGDRGVSFLRLRERAFAAPGTVQGSYKECGGKGCPMRGEGGAENLGVDHPR